MFTSVPRPVWEALGLIPQQRRPFLLADGRQLEQSLGEGRVRIEGRDGPTLIVLAEAGTPARLGAHAMEGLLLAPDPTNQRLIPVTGLLL
ncbi:MAG TPA: hypothetical protein VF157_16185 [Chloroflexota bacterium]